MTSSLRNIVEKINDLPVKEQNAIARLLSEELAWQKSFIKSQDQLSFLAMEARGEYLKGKTKPMDFK